MATTKSLRVFAFARFQAFSMAPLGLIAGILYSFGGAIYDLTTSSWNEGTTLAFLALLGMPVLFAAVGFAAGVAEAVLFNVWAPWFDGVDTGAEH